MTLCSPLLSAVHSTEKESGAAISKSSPLCEWPEGGSQGWEIPGAWRGALTFPPTPTFPLQQEERAAQATGEFEVFVDGKLVHSKKVILAKAQTGRAGGWQCWDPLGVGDLHVRAVSPLCPER